MAAQQLQLPLTVEPIEPPPDTTYRARLERLLSGDLDFHGRDSAYASHSFHSFPAKFPPSCLGSSSNG